MTIDSRTVEIQADSTILKSFIAYPSDTTTKRPLVLVVPEWWGLDDYPKMRAKQLAELGYIAMAVDMYGDGLVVNTPEEAGKQAGALYGNLQKAYDRLIAALQYGKGLTEVDSSKTAAIGYCFGGGILLQAAKMSLPVRAVVSFHGSLKGVPPQKEMVKAEILVLHGAADPLVPESDVNQFKSDMNQAGVPYSFVAYEGAMHAFTNPAATERGKKFGLPIAYNGAADTASWAAMQSFVAKAMKQQ